MNTDHGGGDGNGGGGGGVVLAVDCGTHTTRAVLAVPTPGGGRRVPVLIDGAGVPSGVWVDPDSGALVTGVSAVRAAARRPDCYLSDPLRLVREGTATLTLARRTLTVAAAVGAPLRVLAAEVTRLAGGMAVGAVVMAVPAGWGPKRRTVLRAAATTAGLPDPMLVSTPVAITAAITTPGLTPGMLLGRGPTTSPTSYPMSSTPSVTGVDGLPVEAGSGAGWGRAGVCYLIADASASALTLTVVAPSTRGFEVLATTDLPEAGGTATDHALLSAAGRSLSEVAPDLWARLTGPEWIDDHRDRFALTQAVHTAKHLLADTPRTLIPLPPPHLPVVVDRATLATITAPWRTQLPDTLRALISAADIDPDDLGALVLAGAGAPLPGLADALHHATGLTPLPPLRADTVPDGLLTITHPHPSHRTPASAVLVQAPTPPPAPPLAATAPALPTPAVSQPSAQGLPGSAYPAGPVVVYPPALTGNGAPTSPTGVTVPGWAGLPLAAQVHAAVTGRTLPTSLTSGAHPNTPTSPNDTAGISGDGDYNDGGYDDGDYDDGLDSVSRRIHHALPGWMRHTMSLTTGAIAPLLLAAASLVLILQGLITTERSGVTDPGYWAEVPTPQLTLACLLGILAAWAGAHLIALLISIGDQAPPWGPAERRTLRLTFLTAGAAGLVLTLFYGFLTIQLLAVPNDPDETPWLLPMLTGAVPTAAAAFAVAGMLPRHQHTP